MHTMMDYPLTLAAILERAGQYFPQVEIVSRQPDRSFHRYNWGKMRERARRLAASLLSAGLKKGDRVATLMWNHYAHLECYYGVPIAGGVLHPLNLRLHPDEISYIIAHAEDRFLIVDDVLLPVFEKIRDRTKFERVFVVRHGDGPRSNFEDYEEWVAQGDASFSPPPLSENDGATMCYTSGTTGNPKAVLYSHRALVLHSMAQTMADSCAVSQHDTILLASSMFHANGWGFAFTAGMVGAKFVMPGPHLDGDSLLEMMEQEGVTMSCAVPTVWLALLPIIEKRGPNWRPKKDIRVLCGGTAVPESLLRSLGKHGIQLIHSWGMTETSPQATAARLRPGMEGLPEDEQCAVRAKQGWPVPFVEVRTCNQDGPAPWDGQTMGELEVRGPFVAGSYYKAPEARDRWTTDGWFRTGDVATIGPDGCIRLMDRSKDLVKSGGEWISSVDLENAIMSHSAVREAAVIAVSHPKWQERPLAVVVLKEGAQVQAEELRNFLSAKFAKWQLPDDFVFVNELPHTSTGKLLKTELRKRYAEWKWKAPG